MDSTTTSSTSTPAHRRERGSVIGGLVLIVLGILFLLDNFYDIRFSDYWPLILVAVGVGLLWRSRGDAKQAGE
jgi:hypothetical protein